MGFRYVEMEEAQRASGLRMVVAQGVPSPWGEGAKGLFHLKGIDWLSVALRQDSEAMKDWIGQLSAPVAFYNDEPKCVTAREITELAERIAPQVPMLPARPSDRDTVLDFIDDLANEGGLGWMRRIQFTHWSLNSDDGFPAPIAQYLGAKYGYSEEAAAAAGPAVRSRLTRYAAQLHAQSARGSSFYFGDRLTAADVHLATFMALFSPLPEDQCAMRSSTRSVFTWLDDETRAALDPVLLAHRDRIYHDHLVLPLQL